MSQRLPIIRRDSDGTIIDGTADVSEDGLKIGDFRDLAGNEMPLPPGSAFEVPIDPRLIYGNTGEGRISDGDL